MANIDVMKILGGLLSSGALSRGSGSNALGSVVGALTGGGGTSNSGLGGMLGSMLGGGAPQTGSGGIGDLLGGLLGGGAGAQSSGGGMGDLLGMAMQQFGAAQQGNASQARDQLRGNMPRGLDFDQAERQAEVLIRAMINAAKSDGTVDAGEQEKILGQLGEVSQDEVDFVRRELAEPLDVQGFIQSIPRGMEQQVYAMSLMAIDLDTNREAKYLHELAQGSGLSPDVCNQIHEQFGAPKLYS
jgi:uncharacterized membrane protein YebE (DUF533 family)